MVTKRNKPTIALIDDHGIVRKGLRGLVEAFEEFIVVFDVENFENLKNNLKAYRTLDLLLMDIKMPDKSGFDVVLWMKEHYPQIKVLALSSEEDGFSIAKVMRNGAKGFIGKSAGPAELLLAIKTVLGGDSYLNQSNFNLFSDVIQNSTNYFSNQYLQFTEKEVELLQWCCTGLSYIEIAEKFCVSLKTIESWKTVLFNKIGIHTRQELAVYAVQNKLLN